jgi:hypothetical protein
VPLPDRPSAHWPRSDPDRCRLRKRGAVARDLLGADPANRVLAHRDTVAAFPAPEISPQSPRDHDIPDVLRRPPLSVAAVRRNCDGSDGQSPYALGTLGRVRCRRPRSVSAAHDHRPAALQLYTRPSGGAPPTAHGAKPATFADDGVMASTSLRAAATGRTGRRTVIAVGPQLDSVDLCTTSLPSMTAVGCPAHLARRPRSALRGNERP